MFSTNRCALRVHFFSLEIKYRSKSCLWTVTEASFRTKYQWSYLRSRPRQSWTLVPVALWAAFQGKIL